jgi:hypothetical protein
MNRREKHSLTLAAISRGLVIELELREPGTKIAVCLFGHLSEHSKVRTSGRAVGLAREPVSVTGALESHVEEGSGIQALALLVEPFDQRDKSIHAGFNPGVTRGNCCAKLASRQRPLAQMAGKVSKPAGRHVDDPGQSHRIIRVVSQSQVGQCVAHFAT